MLRTTAVAAAVALLAATVASASAGHATASLSSSAAGARDVGLTVVLRPVLVRCGRLGARSLTLALPGGMRVPGFISRAAVRVTGGRVASVRTAGSAVAIVLAPPSHGASCHSLVLGVVRVQFARDAGLGNPVRAGTYSFGVAARPSGVTWRGSFVVRS